MDAVQDLFDLSGKVALVTGSSSGIGQGIAEAFVAAGAKVAVNGIDPEGCERVTAMLMDRGGEAVSLPCDVSDKAQLDQLVRDTEAQLGPIDILVVNAGGHARDEEPPLSPNSSALEGTLRLNLGQAVHLTDLVCPAMAQRGGGAVILMSSLSAVRGNKMIGAYALAKAAMAQLARNLAVQWGPQNVRANAICPGVIRTPFSQSMLDNPEVMNRRLQNTPMRRVGEPHEIAGAAVFLASKGGAFMTGQTLVIDGGTIITDGN
jgi:NAD(P)-dependent dehydrogenase (short-subunit alcohol dehydrogenase family)